MPSLLVLSLSDSFSSVWPSLAAECGLELELAASVEAFERRAGTVGIVAAGGEESRLPQTFRDLAPTTMEIAAVGSLPDHRLAVEVLQAGASESFALGGDYDVLRTWVSERAERLRVESRRTAFTDTEAGKYNFKGILGKSPALAAALERASRLIPHRNVTVLITGETGTGKELVARALHYNGPRRDGPFVDLNCAAIPEALLESELFGHEKGAFTDASATKPGLLEMAKGGTIFLDEIGHLPLALQGKLLRVLQERQMRRVGGTKQIAVDVRVVAATHVDLVAAIQRGEFRADLYYRLNVVPVELPPLRARREDIVLLAQHFLALFCAEYGLRKLTFTARAEDELRARDWPGNVRELRNAIERAVLLSRSTRLDIEDLEPAMASHATTHGIPFPSSLSDIACAAAHAMVDLCGGNKSEAARRLEISRTRLNRLLENVPGDEGTESFGIAQPESRAVASLSASRMGGIS
jgi:DNA-binding NtrC family response regulator